MGVSHVEIEKMLLGIRFKIKKPPSRRHMDHAPFPTLFVLLAGGGDLGVKGIGSRAGGRVGNSHSFSLTCKKKYLSSPFLCFRCLPPLEPNCWRTGGPLLLFVMWAILRKYQCVNLVLLLKVVFSFDFATVSYPFFGLLDYIGICKDFCQSFLLCIYFNTFKEKIT